MGRRYPAFQLGPVVRFHRLLLEFLPGQLLEYPSSAAKVYFALSGLDAARNRRLWSRPGPVSQARHD